MRKKEDDEKFQASEVVMCGKRFSKETSVSNSAES